MKSITYTMSFDHTLDEPPMKQQKLNNGTSSADDITLKYATRIMNLKTKLKVVLPDEYVLPVPLTRAYVGVITDVKKISNTMRVLNEKLPLNDLGHLKRVRGPNMIIGNVKKFSSTTSIEEFIEKNAPELMDVFDIFKEVDVPAYMPKLKSQYSEVSKNWACNFHPDVYLEKLVSGDVFTGKLHLHRTFMAMNFLAVKWYYKNQKVHLDEDALKSINASIVVDPSSDSVVAVSIDNLADHPVQHSAMVAIDNVAKTQGGGAWSTGENEDVTLSGIDKDLLAFLKGHYPEVKFGAKKCLNKKNIDSTEGKDYDGPYLCTNYYVYMLREPCIMCSMALTHARVKRVFFCFENKDLGGLLSRAKLHTVSYLNHHYEVYTGFL